MAQFDAVLLELDAASKHREDVSAQPAARFVFCYRSSLYSAGVTEARADEQNENVQKPEEMKPLDKLMLESRGGHFEFHTQSTSTSWTCSILIIMV